MRLIPVTIRLGASLAACAAGCLSTTLFAGDGVDIFTLEPSTAIPMTGNGFEIVGTAGQCAAGIPLASGAFELRGGFWGVILNDVYVVLWNPSNGQNDFFNPDNWYYEGNPSGENAVPTDADVVKLTPSLALDMNLMPAAPSTAVIGGLQVLFDGTTGGVARFNLSKVAFVLAGVTEPAGPSLLVKGGNTGFTEAKFESFNAIGTDQVVASDIGLDSSGVGGLGRLRLKSSHLSLLQSGDLIAGSLGRGEFVVESGADATTFGDALLGAASGKRGDAYVKNAGSTWVVLGNTFAVGGQGIGTLNILDGGLVQSTVSSFAVGDGYQSNGTILVSDPGSTLQVNSDAPQTAAFNVGSQGTGALTIANGATLTTGVLGQFSIGTSTGAQGLVALSGGATADLHAQRLAIGDDGGGSLLISGGSVLTSTVQGAQAIDLGAGGGSTGVVSIAGTGSRWQETTAVGQLRIGVVGHGTLSLDGGSLQMPIVTVYPNGEIIGNGLIQGSVLNIGEIRPNSALQGGQIAIQGDYQQAALGAGVAGTLSAVASGSSLTPVGVACTGNAEISGGLAIQSGLTPPSAGQQFTVVSGGTLTGQFDVIYVDGVPDLRADVQYAAADRKGGGDNVVVTFQPLPNSAGLGDPSAEAIAFLPSDGELGDIDGNGEPDLLMSIPSTNAGGSTGIVEVVRNLRPDGSGGLGNDGVIDLPAGTQLLAITSADLNGDGLDDVVAANGVLNGGLVVFQSTGTSLVPWSGPAFPAMSMPAAVASASLNGDKIADLVVACMGDSTIRILLSQPGGGFSMQTLSLPVGSLPCSVDPTDVDSDGDLDVAAAMAGTNRVNVFLNQGNGTFAGSPAIDLEVGAKPIEVVARDIDGFVPPGYSAPLPDLLTIDKNGGTVSVLLNRTGQAGGGPGSPVEFANAVSLPVGLDPRSIAFLDDDEDGDLDMVVAVTENAAQVARKVRNDLSNSSASFNAGGAVADSTGARLLVEGDLDHDGLTDLLVITADAGGVANGFLPPTTARLAPNRILSDLNGDGTVGGADLAILLGSWGLCQSCANCVGDLNSDCKVDAADLAILLGSWGLP